MQQQCAACVRNVQICIRFAVEMTCGFIATTKFSLKSMLIFLRCLLSLSEDLAVSGRRGDVPARPSQVPARFSGEIPP